MDQLCFLIDKDLKRNFKAKVAKEGLTMGEVLSAMVEAYVQRNEAIVKEVRYRVKR